MGGVRDARHPALRLIRPITGMGLSCVPSFLKLIS